METQGNPCPTCDGERVRITAKDRKSGWRWQCKPCQAERVARWKREHHGDYKRLRKFGVSREQYVEMHDAQQGVCAICGRPCPTGRSLAVDHDHSTGRVRGLLCMPCNTAIGQMGDDPERLVAAASYLQR